MAFHQDRSHIGKPPSRLFLIPVTIMALIMGALLIAHLRLRASIGPPPARQFFDGLLVAGSLRDAQSKGFAYCLDFVTTLRCRRANVRLMNLGPFSAAVDLAGGDGRGGFRQITLWHERDQHVAGDLANELERQGWQSCLTMLHNWGDQNILRRKGSPFRVSIDLSYYGKRRIRIIPERFASEPQCS